ncbi:MAG: ABC transporter permease [Deltaproteobacteria bacterium]|jgi:putative ABC transport system permease protein|nr:ABC transporter permease [Deltaproteobacteria bacterium]
MQRLYALMLLALRSAWNRRFTLVLVMLSVSLSTALLVGIERVRSQVRVGFTGAVSGTDLVVGARGGPVQLMLYAVFHMGGASNNIGWDTARMIASRPEVLWTVPISMGDSHGGYPVVGTSAEFFTRFRYRGGRPLELRSGRAFGDVFEAVLGSEVASRMGYREGDPIVVAHGGGPHARLHDDKPFTVVGVLAPTGSPVDRSLYISLESMEAIHVDWQGGAPIRGLTVTPEQVRHFDLTPKTVTAVLVGLKNRRSVFAVQRGLQEYRGEAITAVMPGVALDQLWGLLGGWEKALVAVSLLVTFTGLAGLCSTVLAGLGERRRELAVLRSAGAGPLDVTALLSLEGLMLTLTGIVAGTAALTLATAVAAPWLLDRFGLAFETGLPTAREWIIMGGILVLGLLTSLIPAVRAYFLSLTDGLSPSS